MWTRSALVLLRGAAMPDQEGTSSQQKQNRYDTCTAHLVGIDTSPRQLTTGCRRFDLDGCGHYGGFAVRVQSRGHQGVDPGGGPPGPSRAIAIFVA